MNYVGQKCVSVTMFGKYCDMWVKENLTEDEFFTAFTKCKRLMAEFYFPFLIAADNMLLLFEANLQQNGKYRFENKKKFRQLQTSIRKCIGYMKSYYAVPEYFEELSVQVWDDVKDNIERLRYAMYLVFSRHGIEQKQAETYALMVTTANIIYMAEDTFEAIVKQSHDTNGIAFGGALEHTSCIAAYNFISSWIHDTIKCFEQMEDEIVKDDIIRAGRDAISMTIINPEKMYQRQVAAYDELDDSMKRDWNTSKDVPRNRRRVLIYRNGQTKSFLYSKGYLYANETKERWNTRGDFMWIYESEKDKKAEFTA